MWLQEKFDILVFFFLVIFYSMIALEKKKGGGNGRIKMKACPMTIVAGNRFSEKKRGMLNWNGAWKPWDKCVADEVRFCNFNKARRTTRRITDANNDLATPETSLLCFRTTTTTTTTTTTLYFWLAICACAHLARNAIVKSRREITKIGCCVQTWRRFGPVIAAQFAVTLRAVVKETWRC